jgi:hypothetical protein
MIILDFKAFRQLIKLCMLSCDCIQDVFLFMANFAHIAGKERYASYKILIYLLGKEVTVHVI